jgi:hypothetical protein
MDDIFLCESLKVSNLWLIAQCIVMYHNAVSTDEKCINMVFDLNMMKLQCLLHD